MDQIVNLSTSLLSTTVNTAAWTLKPLLKVIEKKPGTSSTQQVVLRGTIYPLPPNMRKWIAIVGLMGASAVAIGAYGVSVELFVSMQLEQQTFQ